MGKLGPAHARAMIHAAKILAEHQHGKRPVVTEPLILGGRKRRESTVIPPRRDEAAMDGDSDPPCFVDAWGCVRPEAVAAQGFMVGREMVPWPTVAVWNIIIGLPKALQAYLTARLGKQIIIATALGAKAEEDARKALLYFEESDSLYRESGVKFFPERETDIIHNMAWGLLYPVIGYDQADFPQNLLQRPRTSEELELMDMTELGQSLVDNADDIMATIGAYFRAPKRDGGAPPFRLP